jgi:hypothetical protein
MRNSKKNRKKKNNPKKTVRPINGSAKTGKDQGLIAKNPPLAEPRIVALRVPPWALGIHPGPEQIMYPAFFAKCGFVNGQLDFDKFEKWLADQEKNKR